MDWCMDEWMIDQIGWYQLLKWYQITINVIPYFWGIKTIRVYYTRAFTALHYCRSDTRRKEAVEQLIIILALLSENKWYNMTVDMIHGQIDEP